MSSDPGKEFLRGAESETDLQKFFRYVIPTMCFMFVYGLYNIIDGVFIGQAMGKVGLAACLLTFPIYCFLFAFGDMIGVGSSILIAKYRGEKNIVSANRMFSGGVGLILILSVFVLVLYRFCGHSILTWMGASPQLEPISYEYIGIIIFGAFPMLLWLMLSSVLRSDDQPKLSSSLMVFGAVTNIVLDYLFVLRFHWGAAGAAWATVTAEIFVLALGLPYFASKKCSLTFNIRNLFPTFRDAVRICKQGIPSLGAQSAVAIMLLCHNIQSLHWGGEDALAAYAAICCIESLGSMILQGVASGLQPLVSFYFGARDFERIHRFGCYGLIFAFLLGLLGVVFSVAMCQILPGCMGLKGTAAVIASRGLIIGSSAFLAMGVVKVGSHYYQATGRIAASSLLIYGDCVILPLALWVLPWFFSLDGVWMAMPVSRFILLGMMIGLYFWYRYFKKTSLNFVSTRAASPIFIHFESGRLKR